MTSRLKILLSAYACEPGRGSEPEVGWRWATLLAKEHEVTVLTRANNRPLIEAALAAVPGPHPQFIYYDPAPFWVRLKKRGMPVALFYLLWQVGVRWLMRGKLEEYDLIHHVTFNSFSRPGFWWFSGKPVVLGPLGGGQVAPWRLLSLFPKTKIHEIFRSLFVIATPLYPPFLLSCANASIILLANRDTERRIPFWWRYRTARLLETAVPPEELGSECGARALDGLVQVIWVSRFDEIKAPLLALRAFARACAEDARLRLTMVGDGPDHPAAVREIKTLGLEDRVVLAGRMPKEEIPRQLACHDFFLFTSLRDTSGNVLIEAMAAGLPAVCLRHHGAAEITDDETAIRVPPQDVEATTRGLAEAILELAASPERRSVMGAKARARVANHFLWPQKAQAMNAFYQKAIQASEASATGTPK